MSFRINYVEEPELVFLRGNSFTPMAGLIKFGPRFSTTDETGHKWIKVGIIGSGQTLSMVINLLDEMRMPQLPKKPSKWNIPFPGLSKNSPLNFSLTYKTEWQQKISNTEITDIISRKTKTKIAEAYCELIEQKIKIINEKSPPPDVLIITIPKEIEKASSYILREKPLIKLPNEDDLHSRIKLYGMKYKIPTQLIRNDTLMFKKTQEKFFVFWNLAVGLLYKSQKGYPWKLAELEDNTCYVGISFFKERSDDLKKKMRASMAQVFLDTGESFILRGEPFEWSNRKHPNTPHMSEEGSKQIIKKVIEQYKQIKGNKPNRIVIHKSSNYWEDELEGFLTSSDEITTKDFITLQNTDVKFYRPDRYPVLRGIVTSSEDLKENYLYTTGFVPCLNTYPGLNVPQPLLVRAIVQDSDITKICQEILSFTKLDWNNTFIYRKDPVTLSVSRKVGQVLAESIARNYDFLDPHYYFYM